MKGLILGQEEKLRWRVYEIGWLRSRVEGLGESNSAGAAQIELGSPFCYYQGGILAMGAYGTLN
jgi:hypothetical protein